MNQPPLNPDALAQLIMWKELPFGGNPDNYIRLDANAAHKVIELLKPHLAVAQPEVTSVEELAELPGGSIIFDASNSAYEMCQIGWPSLFALGTELDLAIDNVVYPARVLYRPEVKP